MPFWHGALNLTYLHSLQHSFFEHLFNVNFFDVLLFIFIFLLESFSHISNEINMFSNIAYAVLDLGGEVRLFPYINRENTVGNTLIETVQTMSEKNPMYQNSPENRWPVSSQLTTRLRTEPQLQPILAADKATVLRQKLQDVVNAKQNLKQTINNLYTAMKTIPKSNEANEKLRPITDPSGLDVRQQETIPTNDLTEKGYVNLMQHTHNQIESLTQVSTHSPVLNNARLQHINPLDNTAVSSRKSILPPSQINPETALKEIHSDVGQSGFAEMNKLPTYNMYIPMNQIKIDANGGQTLRPHIKDISNPPSLIQPDNSVVRTNTPLSNEPRRSRNFPVNNAGTLNHYLFKTLNVFSKVNDNKDQAGERHGEPIGMGTLSDVNVTQEFSQLESGESVIYLQVQS